MAKRDAEVWRLFIDRHGKDYLAFSYDVALGGSKLVIPGETAEALLGWQYQTAIKIDAVGWQGNQAWIIEVRPDATVSALGAALAYTLVAQRDDLTTLPLVPAIVCRAIQPDVEWCCAQLGIVVFKL